MSPVIRHILVASDDSAASQAAAELACALGARLSARVTLLHVVSPPYVAPPDAVYAATPEELRALGEAARAVLEARVSALARPGLTLDISVHEGAPADTIIAVAARREVDLVVIGTHGRGGIAHLLVGSVAEAVVRHACCPVLT